MKKIVHLIAILAIIAPLSGAFGEGKSTEGKIVNVNTASTEELMNLPGIGKAKAEAIVSFRQAHPFKSVEELVEVKGIGPKMLEKLRGSVTVDGSAPVAVKAPSTVSAATTR